MSSDKATRQSSRDESYPFASAEAWFEHAMRQPSRISRAESMRRAAIAAQHNAREGIVDADTLADQQLYIQGKLTLQEYQQYLLLKHGGAA